VSDRDLVSSFLQMHTAFEAPATTRLERDQRLAEWLRALIERCSAVRSLRSPLSPRDDRALRIASDYLADRPERNVGLDELAAAAGIGKFRLVRLFREHTGLPPHALQIAHRVRKARRLLEGGDTIADIAAASGFDGPELQRAASPRRDQPDAQQLETAGHGTCPSSAIRRGDVPRRLQRRGGSGIRRAGMS
jgi:AraC-like DNA-binding protein